MTEPKAISVRTSPENERTMNRFPQSRVPAPVRPVATMEPPPPMVTIPRPVIGSTQMLPLRDYQTTAITKSTEAYERGITKQLLSLPTGSGKTVVAAHMIREWMSVENRRVLFIVHRDELARQSVDKIREVDPLNSPGIVKAAQNNTYAGTIVASAQTLAYRKRLDQLDEALRGFELLIVSDEAHHDRSISRTRIIEQLAPAKLVGLTATPSRGDKLGLDKIYQEIVHHVSMLELIARGILSPLKGLRIETDTNIDKVGTRAGEFAENELADAVNNDIRNNEIVAAWQEHASKRKRTVAFCVDVKHAFAVRDAFREAGISADTIVGTTEDAERRDILGRFHDGGLQILTNCMVLTEGYDEPLIDCELLCKPTKSPGLYTQMVGRAARKGEGKHDALIIDFVDVTMKHKLITLPTLVGINEDENPGDKAIRPPSEEDRDEGEIMDFLEYAKEREQRRQTRGVQVDLFSASQYLWRTVNGVHMAPAGRNQWLTLIPKGAGYIPAQMFQGNLKVGQKPHVTELFDRPVEQETAMALAEGQVKIGDLTSKTANWRVEAQPATQAQRYYAKSLGIKNIPAGATKGEVSDLIDEALFTEQFNSIKGQYLAV